MPIFEYKCLGCGARFELIVQSSTVPACPSCASQELDKQLSVFAVGNSEPAPQLGPGCSSCTTKGSGGCPLD